MRRALPIVTLLLFVLVVADRIVHARHADNPPSAPVTESRPATASTPGRAVAAAELPARSLDPSAQPDEMGAGGTLDRLARMAARRQLSAEAGQTYLDSLILTTDSVVRRWPDRGGTPLRVCIIAGAARDWSPRMSGFVRDALDRWEGAGIGIRFTVVADTSSADITVRWIDHFDIDRAGQTDLTWDQTGRVRKAAVSLALRTTTGVVIPDPALVAVAAHEAGHALGLPHSADSLDVMFPATRTGELSSRDRRTALVLYQLPTGPLRDAIAVR